MEEHLSWELFRIEEDGLEVFDGFETDLLFKFDDFDDKVEFVFELLFRKFSFACGLVHLNWNWMLRMKLGVEFRFNKFPSVYLWSFYFFILFNKLIS